jgi:multiple sugar transport system substrate-binding protein
MQRERKDSFWHCFRGLLSWLAFSSLFLAACNSRNPESKPLKAPSKSIIKVSCVPGPAADVLKRFSPAFEAANNISVETTVRPAGSPPDPKADLWIVEPAVMPSLAFARSIQPVPDIYTADGDNYAWRSLIRLYRSKLLVWGTDKDVFALPLVDEAVFCLYRNDLLTDPSARSQFKAKFGRELTSPATWQDILRIAEFFQGKPRPGIERPCASLPPLPKDDNSLDRMFYLVAAPFVRHAVREDRMSTASPRNLFSFHYDLDTGKPLLHTRGFAEALDCLSKLQRFRAAGDDPEQSFASGEAVLCIASAPAIARFQKSPAIKNKFRIARPPGSDTVYGIDLGQSPVMGSNNEIPYLGAAGALMVVPKSTANGADAFKLAAFLSNPKTSRDVVTEPDWGGGIYRDEHVKLGFGSFGLDSSQTLDYARIMNETYLDTKLSNPLVRLRIPDQASHRAALLKEVRAALLAGKPAAQAMNEADAAWRELDAKMSPAERLSTYRLSISLGGGG